MGTWGADIFDDDLALDIRDDFEDALSKGLGTDDALQKVLEEYSEVVEDDDEGPIVYLTLALLQLEKGELVHVHRILEKALHIIESGKGLKRWEEAGSDALAERKQVLRNLKKRLSIALGKC